ncbi:hypothetical protein [Aquimarina muelleri]|uniref:Uncharacterized protein n=1 Tax=Aquimarina muelleri TaxID=279356 RepID=A0A918N303_9FLAO|nr:hypothetical protein [Aquimarina muelleri]MCX2764561.1 hypothetical protein [Aquimarina muelleri]GGX23080.1 hypothetical protein GCM10007384_25350 [Aquimarina muelleri]
MRNFRLLILPLFVILLNSCNDDEKIEPLNNQNFIKSFAVTVNEGNNSIIGYIDEDTSTILIEYSDEMDLKNLKTEIIVSENATIIPNSGELIDLSKGTLTFTVTSENGSKQEYKVAGYTKNLLKNPKGNNMAESWVLNGDVGVDETNNEFYIVKYENPARTDITQLVKFNRDYSDKYILFIGDLTTEKTVEGSITRHPYFWGHQNGPFNFDENLYEEIIQGMIHLEKANVWEVVSRANPLLKGVEAVIFKMGQASQVGDSLDGTKCKFRDIEVRIFESIKDSEIYVSNLYRK